MPRKLVDITFLADMGRRPLGYTERAGQQSAPQPSMTIPLELCISKLPSFKFRRDIGGKANHPDTELENPLSWCAARRNPESWPRAMCGSPIR
jgi:hypothetical protein